MSTWRRVVVDRGGIVVAIAAFLCLGVWLTDRLPAWNEEVSVFPSVGYRVMPAHPVYVDPTGALPLEHWCGERDAPLMITSASRPNLSLCVGGMTLPIMVTPYFAGLFYWPMAAAWPLHHGDLFLVRKIALLIGVLSLLLTHRLITRIEDRRTADLACLVVAVSSAFTYVHGWLVHYETMPWVLLVAAALTLDAARLAPSETRPPSTRLVALGGLLIGLAVLANLKAVFLIAPALVVSARERVRFRALRPLQWIALVAALAFTLLPVLLFALYDPNHGFQGQASSRIAPLIRHLDPRRIGPELLNAATFASDIATYLELIADKAPSVEPWSRAITLVALLYCMVASAWRLVTHRGPRLAAACGAIVGTYVIVVILLYEQYPPGNYAPLHTVFAVAVTAFARDLGRAVASLSRRPAVGRLHLEITLPLLAAAMMLAQSLRRGSPDVYVDAPVNAGAERAVRDHLLEHPEDGATVLTATYDLAGMFDSLGRGRIEPIQIQHYLNACQEEVDDASAVECVAARFHAILSRDQRLPARIILPTRLVSIEQPRIVVAHLAEGLEKAAHSLRLPIAIEATFRTSSGAPVLALYRVGRADHDKSEGTTP